VRTWFDQPGRKVRRRQARAVKATTLGARPLQKLRPAVRAPTVRYNRKVREGRGFTLGELKAAGIPRKEAPGLGIVVDHRRRNLSEEGMAVNVERLKAYKTRLIVFPRKTKKPKKGDSTVRWYSAMTITVLHSLLSTGRRSQGGDHPRADPAPVGLRARGSPCDYRGGEGVQGVPHAPHDPRRRSQRGCAQSQGGEGKPFICIYTPFR
jgi:ribosomal protein L13E